jgi:phosphohistidine phosphatase
MKELLLLRHAKSSRDEPDLDDHERPLNERGERDAPRMGRWLRHQRILPDRIVSSTAVRARATAQKLAAACGYAGEIGLTPRLYLAEPDECLAVLREIPDRDGSVLLVGHNPCFEDLVERLVGRPERMPTAALARIALPLGRWQDATLAVRGELLALWRPKELPPEP